METKEKLASFFMCAMYGVLLIMLVIHSLKPKEGLILESETTLDERVKQFDRVSKDLKINYVDEIFDYDRKQ